MKARTSPFGMFAAVAAVGWGNETDLRSTGQLITRSRVDLGWLLRFARAIETSPDALPHLGLQADLYVLVAGGRAVLTGAVAADGAATARAVSIRATPLVRRILKLTRTPIAFPVLLDILCPGATPSRAAHARVLATLCRHGFLVTSLRPSLTAADPPGALLRALASVPPAKAEAERLTGIVRLTQECDRVPPERAPELYRQLQQVTDGPGRDHQRGSSVTVDAALRLSGRIHRSVAAEAALAARLLVHLSPFPTGDPAMHVYRAAFTDRFGDEWVPLLELLDPDLGLGPPPWAADATPARTERDDRLRQLALRASAARGGVVHLNDETIALLAGRPLSEVRAPETLEVFASVFAATAADIDAGRFLLCLSTMAGVSGAGRSLARFADFVPGADRLVADVARIELHSRDDGSVPAEVTFVPRDPRDGNVMCHPPAAGWEIPFGVMAAARVIPPSELLVGVRDGRFVVRWARSGARVSPRVGHLLADRHLPTAARFLLAVRREGHAAVHAFSWGAASDLPRLPRLQYGRVVLHPAQWIFEPDPDDCSGPGAWATAVRRWRHEAGVPRQVQLLARGHALPLDLENEAHVELLLEDLRRSTNGRVILQESFAHEGGAWLIGPDGPHLVELAVSLALTSVLARAATARVPSSEAVPPPRFTPRDRSRPPGSDWLYAKLFCSRHAAEDLIGGPVADLGSELESQAVADRWFLVRYADPAAQLRVRFHAADQTTIPVLLSRVASWAADLVDQEFCTSFALETYRRELERYGGLHGMEIAEDLACVDTTAAIQILRSRRAGLLDLDEVTTAAVSVDDLLTSFGLTPAERARWCAHAVQSRTVAGRAYRERKELLRALLSSSGPPLEVRARAGRLPHILAVRRLAVAPLRARLEELAGAGQLGRTIGALLRSYVHLHCNRLAGPYAEVEQLALGVLWRTRDGLVRSTSHES